MHNSRDSRQVGRVARLWRYPVKSMGGEALTEVDASWQGFAGDRRWAFLRDGMRDTGFPWLTLRDCEAMGHYRPSFLDATRPDTSRTMVRTPRGETLEVTDPALGEALWPAGAQVIRQHRGIFDTFPLSLITTRTIRSLGEAVGRELDVRRFRPNLLVEAEGEAPYPEDDWVGSVLRIGSLRMRVDKRDGRCLVITIDPETSERDPEVLRTVARDREGCLGVYGTTVEPGRIALNDPVLLESPG